MFLFHAQKPNPFIFDNFKALSRIGEEIVKSLKLEKPGLPGFVGFVGIENDKNKSELSQSQLEVHWK